MDGAAAVLVTFADRAVKIDCQCGAQMNLATSRMHRGERYRRFSCPACGRKETRLGENADRLLPQLRSRTNRRFDLETIKAIRSSDDGRRVLAKRYGCSQEMIRSIRAGIAYRDMLPEGFRTPPKPGDPSCEQCRHWAAEACGMGFPDPAEEGLGFARDCALYQVEG
jgi:predicted RNA-binding Zn-ribbon protein involved in translation (DUF1610 family)